MVSPIHSGARGINRTLPGPVHRFHIVKNDKTAVNTSLVNVYCSAKIEIAQIHMLLDIEKVPQTVSSFLTFKLLLFQYSICWLIQQTKNATSIKVKIGAHRHSPPFFLATLLSNAMRNTDNNKDKIKVTVIRVKLALVYIQYDKLFRNHVFVMSTD
jgi:hypothetical protein